MFPALLCMGLFILKTKNPASWMSVFLSGPKGPIHTCSLREQTSNRTGQGQTSGFQFPPRTTSQTPGFYRLERLSQTLGQGAWQCRPNTTTV